MYEHLCHVLVGADDSRNGVYLSRGLHAGQVSVLQAPLAGVRSVSLQYLALVSRFVYLCLLKDFECLPPQYLLYRLLAIQVYGEGVG